MNTLEIIVESSKCVGYHGIPVELCSIIESYIPGDHFVCNIMHIWKDCRVEVVSPPEWFPASSFPKDRKLHLEWPTIDGYRSSEYFHSHSVRNVQGYNEWLINIAGKQLTQFKIERNGDGYVIRKVRTLSFETPHSIYMMDDDGFEINTSDGNKIKYSWSTPYTRRTMRAGVRKSVFEFEYGEGSKDFHYDDRSKNGWCSLSATGSALFIGEREIERNLPSGGTYRTLYIVDRKDAFIAVLHVDTGIFVFAWKRLGNDIQQYIRTGAAVRADLDGIIYGGSSLSLRGRFTEIDPHDLYESWTELTLAL